MSTLIEVVLGLAAVAALASIYFLPFFLLLSWAEEQVNIPKPGLGEVDDLIGGYGRSHYHHSQSRSYTPSEARQSFSDGSYDTHIAGE